MLRGLIVWVKQRLRRPLKPADVCWLAEKWNPGAVVTFDQETGRFVARAKPESTIWIAPL